ncbi:MAG TPA: hypothetical protein VG711_09935, partial [Phycisphaerales bacterium]|nr:hypothetical protein [Phycisphaerales bacterium]
MPRLPDEIPDSMLRILLTHGVGPVLYERLREQLGDDDAIVAARVAELKEIEGIGDVLGPAIRASMDAADPNVERQAMKKANASLIFHTDADYP